MNTDIIQAAGNEDINAFEKGFTQELKLKAASAINDMKDTIINNTLDKISQSDED